MFFDKKRGGKNTAQTEGNFQEEVGVDDCNCWRVFIVLFWGGRRVKDRVYISLSLLRVEVKRRFTV